MIKLSLVANDRVTEEFDPGLLTPARQKLHRLNSELAATRAALDEASKPVDRKSSACWTGTIRN